MLRAGASEEAENGADSPDVGRGDSKGRLAAAPHDPARSGGQTATGRDCPQHLRGTTGFLGAPPTGQTEQRPSSSGSGRVRDLH